MTPVLETPKQPLKGQHTEPSLNFKIKHLFKHLLVGHVKDTGVVRVCVCVRERARGARDSGLWRFAGFPHSKGESEGH